MNVAQRHIRLFRHPHRNIVRAICPRSWGGWFWQVVVRKRRRASIKRAVALDWSKFVGSMPLPAQRIEARSGETGTGSIRQDESPVAASDAP